MPTDPQSLVIDGVTYRWGIEEDPQAGSHDMSHRGLDIQTVAITGDDGSSIRFVLPEHDLRSRGWWRGPRRLTPEVIERAVRIARRSPNETTHRLIDNAVTEAFDGPPTTLQQDLDAASAACNVLARGDAQAASRDALVTTLLEIGCSGQLAKPKTDEWVVQHAQELFGASRQLRLILDEDGDNEQVYRNRSAIAFLIEMCERNQVGVALDTSHADAQLKKRSAEPRRPWGIPESHWWWLQHQTT